MISLLFVSLVSYEIFVFRFGFVSLSCNVGFSTCVGVFFQGREDLQCRFYGLARVRHLGFVWNLVEEREKKGN